MPSLSSVCVFCGSSFGARPEYREAAVELGRTLAARKITLVYGGSSAGLMGVLADETLAAGGHVIGVIPQALVDCEIAHRGLPDLRVVKSMHERKALMAELAQAFIALPGGFGTFEEFCEVLTWSQLGLHRKPCGLLNIAGYYSPLLTMFDHATGEGFVRPAHRETVLADASAGPLLDKLAAAEAPVVRKWPAAIQDGATSRPGSSPE